MDERMLMGTATNSGIAAVFCFAPEAVLQYSGRERTVHFLMAQHRFSEDVQADISNQLS